MDTIYARPGGPADLSTVDSKTALKEATAVVGTLTAGWYYIRVSTTGTVGTNAAVMLQATVDVIKP